MEWQRSLVLLSSLAAVLLRCGPSPAPHTDAIANEMAPSSTGSFTCGIAPGPTNEAAPLFSKPFDGQFPLTNYFDHDLPFQFEDSNGFQLTSCGKRSDGGVDGHSGYDWVMPTGTPLKAVASGEVIEAGFDRSFHCSLLGRVVTDQRFVEILHLPQRGEQYSSVYVHVSEVFVQVGDRVKRGQTIALSGNTGCSTEPHLHFHVWRRTHTNSGSPVRIDPFGWDGTGPDPWAGHPQGAESVWLWRQGEAPFRVLR